MSRNIHIAAIGTLTPVGEDTAMSLASIQAGLNVYADSPYLNRAAQPLKMALIPAEALPDISPEVNFHGAYSNWHKHLLRLAQPALEQALKTYSESHPIPLILAVAENHPHCPDDFPQNFIATLAQQSQLPLCLQRSRILHNGRAGVIEAIALAEKYLYEMGFEQVLVGGVDSYQRAELLQTLWAEKRIAGEGNMDGFTPGEGAGFIRLTRIQPEVDPNMPCAAFLSDVRIAAEPGHMYSDGDYLGEGLATAVTETCEYQDEHTIDDAFIGANGERYWAKELGTALIRNQKVLSEKMNIHHPAEYYGDLGAATAAVLIALASVQKSQQATPSTSLICVSSDQWLRASVLINVHAQEEPGTDTTAQDESLSTSGNNKESACQI